MLSTFKKRPEAIVVFQDASQPPSLALFSRRGPKRGGAENERERARERERERAVVSRVCVHYVEINSASAIDTSLHLPRVDVARLCV